MAFLGYPGYPGNGTKEISISVTLEGVGRIRTPFFFDGKANPRVNPDGSLWAPDEDCTAEGDE